MRRGLRLWMAACFALGMAGYAYAQEPEATVVLDATDAPAPPPLTATPTFTATAAVPSATAIPTATLTQMPTATPLPPHPEATESVTPPPTPTAIAPPAEATPEVTEQPLPGKAPSPMPEATEMPPAIIEATPEVTEASTAHVPEPTREGPALPTEETETGSEFTTERTPEASLEVTIEVSPEVTPSPESTAPVEVSPEATAIPAPQETPAPPAPGAIIGAIHRAAAPHSGIWVTLYDQTGEATKTITLDEGLFTFSAVPPGEYQLIASASGYLPFALTVRVHAGEITKLAPAALVPGDLNSDGAIDEADLELLMWGYGMSAAAAPPGADFNGDGLIGLEDLHLLAANLQTANAGS